MNYLCVFFLNIFSFFTAICIINWINPKDFADLLYLLGMEDPLNPQTQHPQLHPSNLLCTYFGGK